jgi:hypothetical protein
MLWDLCNISSYQRSPATSNVVACYQVTCLISQLFRVRPGRDQLKHHAHAVTEAFEAQHRLRTASQYIPGSSRYREVYWRA